MGLLITTECNRRCPFCFVGPLKDGASRRMSVADVDRLCRFWKVRERSPDFGLTLLGGEPTLHPDLLAIVDAIRAHNPAVAVPLLTNLTCSTELLAGLVQRRVQFLVNLVDQTVNSPEQERDVERNLDFLDQVPGLLYNLAVTIASPGDRFDHLYRVLRSSHGRHVWSVRLGISSPGTDFANRFPRQFSPKYGKKYVEIVTACHQINPRLEFINECAVNLCLMSEEDYLRLSRVVRKLNLVCAEPNLDVLPGFSAQWCFALRDVPALRVDNVFDFPDADSLRRELMRRALQFAATTAAGCQHAKCKTILCRGPCPAYAHWAAVSASR